MAKKNELVTIDSNRLPVIEWQGVRVVTTETLAAGYGASTKNIQDNLLNNKSRFIDGVHYYKLEGDELRQFKKVPDNIGLVSKHTSQQILWTEKGAARMSKIVDTDEAWSFFEKMESAYFHQRRPEPVSTELSRLEILQMAIESEQNYLTEKARADKAERTKSQISRSREAKALGKLGAVTRKCKELEERLGESTKHATITAVQNATEKKYQYAPLRKWCRENNIEPTEAPDPRYGHVKSWPAEAWLAVYGADLKKLFGKK
ncbi:ORF6N domain-containing protein [Xenorhabdus lircayensis]|uniref:ORF6N domain-containing protein n=1 Tax=Xenorhabdus lircayensis TaxID=2763499 RepID=A0ABS0U923_9GAMM|nr:ORF6N domain-containing protein [Xenorhabdus lircayensis]MBI6550132.1 ORF6N domain-containing protein [Xenorhabdus lircayensis]